jgi:hypothetical protein
MDVQITRAGSFTLYGDPAVVGMDYCTPAQ